MCIEQYDQGLLSQFKSPRQGVVEGWKVMRRDGRGRLTPLCQYFDQKCPKRQWLQALSQSFGFHASPSAHAAFRWAQAFKWVTREGTGTWCLEHLDFCMVKCLLLNPKTGTQSRWPRSESFTVAESREMRILKSQRLADWVKEESSE